MATLSGTYQWDSSLSAPATSATTYGADVSFTSNGGSYSSIIVTTESGVTVVYYDGTCVYYDGWEDEGYRMIEVSSGTVSDEFASYFSSNASEYSPEYTISYYVRKKYYNPSTGGDAYETPTLVTTQTYKAGATINPPPLPTEAGHTPTDWEY